MDSHFTNANFNNTAAFDNLIPYQSQPETVTHHERKDFSAPQSHPQDSGHFIVYQQPSGFNQQPPFTTIDSSNLYSDLDTIDETPLGHPNTLGHSNIADLYDTDPLDNGMINHNDGHLFQSTSNLPTNMFGSYEEPKLARFNTNLVDATCDNAVVSQANVMQSQIQSAQHMAIPSQVLRQTTVIQPQNRSILVTQSASNVIQPNPNSIQPNPTSLQTSTTTPLEPIPTRSFYTSGHTQNVTPPVEKPDETPPQPDKDYAPNGDPLANGPVDNYTDAAVSQDVSEDIVACEVSSETAEASANVVENDVEDSSEPSEEAASPVEDDEVEERQPVRNGVEVGGEGGRDDDGGKDEEKKEELEKCVREGCENVAVVNTEWEDEYCSNECCIKHCTSVFNAWVQENLKNGVQNEGNNTMM